MNRMKNSIGVIFIQVSIVVIVLPVLVLLVWSFTNNYVWPGLLPDNFGLRGWNYVIQNNSRVLDSLKNSIYIAFMTTFITIMISLPCANSLAFDEFKGKKIVELLVFSPIIIPPVSIGMGLNVEFIKLGLSRTYLGVILVSVVPCIPYAVRILKEIFLVIGRDYQQHAGMLGANRLYVFRKITMPLLIPGIVSAGMMCYIVSFSQYFLVYLIGGGKIITFTMDMFPFIQSGDRMMGSVYGLIFILATVFSLLTMEFILKKIYHKEIKDYYA